MSYYTNRRYTNRRYNPPADVYRASALIGQHTGKNAWTLLAQNPTLDTDLQQFRSDRSTTAAADDVRAKLGL